MEKGHVIVCLHTSGNPAEDEAREEERKQLLLCFLYAFSSPLPNLLVFPPESDA